MQLQRITYLLPVWMHSVEGLCGNGPQENNIGHRIIELFELEGNLKGHLVQLHSRTGPPTDQVAQNPIQPDLRVSRDGAFTKIVVTSLLSDRGTCYPITTLHENSFSI